MKTMAPHRFSRARMAAFSLVEVTVAIGIFAFVVVGVIGLLPAGLRMRADSAAETRGVLIAEEFFASVRAATNLSRVVVRDGPGLRAGNNRTVNLLTGQSVLGYPIQTTVPYWSFDTAPGRAWTNAGGTDAEIRRSSVNAIDTLARLSAKRLTNGVSTNLYLVTVEVRAPASLALTNTRPAVFTSVVTMP
jgi:type II secretory pathway pseudopilin PulG